MKFRLACLSAFRIDIFKEDIPFEEWYEMWSFFLDTPGRNIIKDLYYSRIVPDDDIVKNYFGWETMQDRPYDTPLFADLRYVKEILTIQSGERQAQAAQSLYTQMEGFIF